MIAESGGQFISHVLDRPNLWFFNLYLPVATGLEILLASYLLRPFIAKKMPYVFAAYMVLWGTVIWQHSIFDFAVTCLLATALLCTILFTVILIDNAMNSDKGIFKDPLFWLCVAEILYYACDIPEISTFTTAADEFIHKNKYMAIIGINEILNVISPLLTGVSLVLCGRQNKLQYV